MNHDNMERLLTSEAYKIPRECEKCGGVLVFKGVGEYQCEDCGETVYDDYGKVRIYIEEHKGATAAEVEAAIGVSQKTIRRLLKDGRIEIAEGSKMFLHCEICDKLIRSGRYCPECEIKVHRNLEEKQRADRAKNAQGFGTGNIGDEGQRRFMRGE